jgi:hypothetical protein
MHDCSAFKQVPRTQNLKQSNNSPAEPATRRSADEELTQEPQRVQSPIGEEFIQSTTG